MADVSLIAVDLDGPFAIAPGNDNEGVAWALETFVLGEL